MGKVRATVLIDAVLAARVRQMFSGNLSKGITVLVQQQLSSTPVDKGFGLLKGHGTGWMEELKKIREEDEEAHEHLRR